MDESFGIIPQFRAMRLAREAREKGDNATAEYYDMQAKLAANRERNRISRLPTPTSETPPKK